MTSRDNVLIQRNAIAANELLLLSDYLRRAEWKDSLVSNFEDDADGDAVEWVVNKKIRDTQEAQLSEPVIARLNSIVEASVRAHIDAFYDVVVRDWEPVHILHYGSGGHYIPHVDAETLYKDDSGLDFWEKTLDRDLSVVYFLNDDFKGGELVFPDLDLAIAPEAGMLVCFPSDHHFIHGVKPVLSGHRYTLVTWLRVTGMPTPEEINRMNMDEYHRLWPRQIEQPSRLRKGGGLRFVAPLG